jgi:hypothetical protein
VRRTDHNLRHDHQTSEGFGLTGFHPSSFNPQTSPAWAIARSDMLILEPEGKDAENIKLGSTLRTSRKLLSFGIMNETKIQEVAA